METKNWSAHLPDPSIARQQQAKERQQARQQPPRDQATRQQDPEDSYVRIDESPKDKLKRELRELREELRERATRERENIARIRKSDEDIDADLERMGF